MVADLLDSHPIVGVLAIVSLVWVLLILAGLVLFMFLNPEAPGVTNIGVTLAGAFGLATLNLRKLKGVE